MPKRMLDGDISISHSLNQLTDGGETCFYRVMVLCDDKGRFDGRMDYLFSRLYPLKPKITRPMVIKRLEELEREDLIHWYDVEGKHYGHLPTWHKFQRLRHDRCKYPDPEGFCDGCLLAASGGQNPPRSRREVEGKEEVEDSRTATDPDPPPKPARKRKPPPPAWALDASGHLIKHLTEVPGARITKNALMAWAREIELMPGEIPELAEIVEHGGAEALLLRLQVAIEDATGPEAMRSADPEVRKFSPQIRCGASLRTKWDQITAAAARRKPRNQSPEEFARRISEAR